MLTYIAAIALSIPGSTLLSLLCGYLFPQPLSTLYVVVAATCGAILVFLTARTALADSLRKRAGPFLQKMELGFRRNMVSYLFFLRFIPLFPFWLVNIAAAAFGVPLRTFIWTTFVGIIPGSFVFTLVGEGLEKIVNNQGTFSLRSIINPEILVALILLGILSLLPVFLKKK